MTNLALFNPTALPTAAATLFTGLVQAEQKVIGQVFIPANAFRDVGQLTFDLVGINTTDVASSVFTFNVYYDTVPIRVVAGAASGTAILLSAGATVPNVTWDPTATDSFRIKLTLFARRSIDSVTEIAAHIEGWVTASITDGTATTTTPYQSAVVAGTVTGSGTFTADNYFALTVSSTVTNTGFKPLILKVDLDGRSQGIL